MIRNQIVTRFDYPLAPGMDVTILKKKPSPNLTLRKMNLLYEDEHLLVIEKSAGLLSVATAKEIEETAFSILKSYIRKSHHRAELYIVHRLDRDTSASWCLPRAKRFSSNCRTIGRRPYETDLLCGGRSHVKNAEGEIVSCLKENNHWWCIHQKFGRRTKSCYRYRVWKSNARYSLLSFFTDRQKNQIRFIFRTLVTALPAIKNTER